MQCQINWAVHRGSMNCVRQHYNHYIIPCRRERVPGYQRYVLVSEQNILATRHYSSEFRQVAY